MTRYAGIWSFWSNSGMLCRRCHRLVHPNGRPGIHITRQTIDRAERFLCGLEPLSLRFAHHYHEDDP